MRKQQPIIAFVLILTLLTISVSSLNTNIPCAMSQECVSSLSPQYSASQISCVNNECVVDTNTNNNNNISNNVTSNQNSSNQIIVQTTTAILNVEINNLKSKIAKLKTEISSIKSLIQAQSGSATILKSDVNVVKNQVTQIQNQVNQINDQLGNSLNQIQNSVSGVSNGLAVLQEEINSTKTGLTNLEEDIKTRRSRTILLFFLVILAVAGGTFYFIYRRKRSTDNNEKQSQPDIINYITQHIKQGVKFPEIKNKLLQTGWSSSDVDSAYQKTMKHNYQKYLKKTKDPTTRKQVVSIASAKKNSFDPKKGVAIAIISILLMVGVLLVLKEATGKAIYIQESFAHDEIYECTPPHIVSPEGTCCLDNNNNTICDKVEKYEEEKAEVSAEFCSDDNECSLGKICINNNCSTIEEQYNTDCEGQKCNLNQIEISTSDGESLTLSPGKGGYTGAGAVSWTIKSIQNYCKNEQIKIPIEIEKKGMICYNQEGEEVSCNQKTNLNCENNDDCSECLNLYGTACKCSSNICELDVISTKRIETLNKETIMLNVGQTSQPITHPSSGINQQLNDFTLKLNNVNEFCFG